MNQNELATPMVLTSCVIGRDTLMQDTVCTGHRIVRTHTVDWWHRAVGEKSRVEEGIESDYTSVAESVPFVVCRFETEGGNIGGYGRCEDVQ